MEHIVFLTGRLAQPQLEKVLAGIDDAPFSFEVREIGLQVAALMTADMIRRRVAAPVITAREDGGLQRADRIIVPGRCRGDCDALSAHYGVPVQRGPEELKDLPRFFNRAAKPVDLSRHAVAIFAEIVDAPRLGVDALLARAAALRRDGADVIDLGCLPETPFAHLEDAVQALKAAGYSVSVDSVDPQELLRGGRAGADYLLSLNEDSLWIADEVHMDAVTAISGSGPAYVFLFIEALQQAARELGLTPAQARQLSIEMVLGSAKLAAQSDEAAGVLRERVTSKGGTTEAALRTMEERGVREGFIAGVLAANVRGRELGDLLGKDD